MSKPKPKPNPLLEIKAKAIVAALRKRPVIKPKPIRLTLEEMALKLVRQQIKIDRDKKFIKIREYRLDDERKSLRDDREKLNTETANLVIYELFARDVYHAVKRWEKNTKTDRDTVLAKEIASYRENWATRARANGNLSENAT